MAPYHARQVKKGMIVLFFLPLSRSSWSKPFTLFTHLYSQEVFAICFQQTRSDNGVWPERIRPTLTLFIMSIRRAYPALCTVLVPWCIHYKFHLQHEFRVPTMQQQHGHLYLRSELLSIWRLLHCHVPVGNLSPHKFEMVTFCDYHKCHQWSHIECDKYKTCFYFCLESGSERRIGGQTEHPSFRMEEDAFETW